MRVRIFLAYGVLVIGMYYSVRLLTRTCVKKTSQLSVGQHMSLGNRSDFEPHSVLSTIKLTY